MARAEKCPSCGAPLKREYGKDYICEYCGSFFPVPDAERRDVEYPDRSNIRSAYSDVAVDPAIGAGKNGVGRFSCAVMVFFVVVGAFLLYYFSQHGVGSDVVWLRGVGAFFLLIGVSGFFVCIIS